jgi:hypothetical protein
MVFLPQVALQELPVDILSIGTIARREVLVDRNQRAALHGSSIPYEQVGPNRDAASAPSAADPSAF